MQPQTWVFLPNASASGLRPKCSCAHIFPVMPMPVCTSSRMKKRVVLVGAFACSAPAGTRGRKWLSPPSPWIGSTMIAAMSSGFAANARVDLVERLLLGGRHVALDLGA